MAKEKKQTPKDKLIEAIRTVGGRVSPKGEIKSPLGFVLATITDNALITADGRKVGISEIDSADNNSTDLEIGDRNGNIILSIPRAVNPAVWKAIQNETDPEEKQRRPKVPKITVPEGFDPDILPTEGSPRAERDTFADCFGFVHKYRAGEIVRDWDRLSIEMKQWLDSEGFIFEAPTKEIYWLGSGMYEQLPDDWYGHRKSR